MSTQHENQARRREAILAAAQRRFAQYGHAKVTMDEIAADVGIGKASIYYYFPTKEDLFRAVVKHEQEEFLRLMEPILTQETSSTRKLSDYLARRLEYFRNFVNLSSLSTNALLQPDPLFVELFRALNKHDHRMIESILEGGVRSGEFTRCVDVKETAELCTHLLQGLRLRALKRHGTGAQEEGHSEHRRDLERLAALLVRALNNHQDTTETHEADRRISA
jgi:TetR/AcrR family transcriptional regulator